MYKTEINCLLLNAGCDSVWGYCNNNCDHITNKKMEPDKKKRDDLFDENKVSSLMETIESDFSYSIGIFQEVCCEKQFNIKKNILKKLDGKNRFKYFKSNPYRGKIVEAKDAYNIIFPNAIDINILDNCDREPENKIKINDIANNNKNFVIYTTKELLNTINSDIYKFMENYKNFIIDNNQTGINHFDDINNIDGCDNNCNYNKGNNLCSNNPRGDSCCVSADKFIFKNGGKLAIEIQENVYTSSLKYFRSDLIYVDDSNLILLYNIHISCENNSNKDIIENISESILFIYAEYKKLIPQSINFHIVIAGDFNSSNNDNISINLINRFKKNNVILKNKKGDIIGIYKEFNKIKSSTKNCYLNILHSSGLEIGIDSIYDEKKKIKDTYNNVFISMSSHLPIFFKIIIKSKNNENIKRLNNMYILLLEYLFSLTKGQRFINIHGRNMDCHETTIKNILIILKFMTELRNDISSHISKNILDDSIVEIINKIKIKKNEITDIKKTIEKKNNLSEIVNGIESTKDLTKIEDVKLIDYIKNEMMEIKDIMIKTGKTYDKSETIEETEETKKIPDIVKVKNFIKSIEFVDEIRNIKHIEHDKLYEKLIYLLLEKKSYLEKNKIIIVNMEEILNHLSKFNENMKKIFKTFNDKIIEFDELFPSDGISGGGKKKEKGRGKEKEKREKENSEKREMMLIDEIKNKIKDDEELFSSNSEIHKQLSFDLFEFVKNQENKYDEYKRTIDIEEDIKYKDSFNILLSNTKLKDIICELKKNKKYDINKLKSKTIDKTKYSFDKNDKEAVRDYLMGSMRKFIMKFENIQIKKINFEESNFDTDIKYTEIKQYNDDKIELSDTISPDNLDHNEIYAKIKNPYILQNYHKLDRENSKLCQIAFDKHLISLYEKLNIINMNIIFVNIILYNIIFKKLGELNNSICTSCKEKYIIIDEIKEKIANYEMEKKKFQDRIELLAEKQSKIKQRTPKKIIDKPQQEEKSEENTEGSTEVTKKMSLRDLIEVTNKLSLTITQITNDLQDKKKKLNKEKEDLLKTIGTKIINEIMCVIDISGETQCNMEMISYRDKYMKYKKKYMKYKNKYL